MYDVLLTAHWPEQVVNRLTARYRVEVWQGTQRMSTNALVEASRRFDVICPTVTDRIEPAVFDVPDLRVRLLANYGVGFEHIDLHAAQAAGVIVTNTPGVLTEATADIAILLLLTASRRGGEGERQLRAGAWAGWAPTHLVGQSVSGKLLGLVGFGRIAQATALRARALGMRIAYYGRRRADPEVEQSLDALYYPELERLAADADVLSLHCPGGNETRHLIDGALLSRMKSTAILINTARGSVVDDAALATALSNGTIWAAGLDVYDGEPRVSEALKSLENIVLLPHLGSATIETRTAMGMRAVDNIDAVLSGAEPLDRVV